MSTLEQLSSPAPSGGKAVRLWLLAAIPPLIGLGLVLAGLHVPGLVWLLLVGVPLIAVRVAPVFSRVWHDTMTEVRLPAGDDTALAPVPHDCR